MAIKLKFWKKSDLDDLNLGLGDNLGLNNPEQTLGRTPYGQQPAQEPFEQPSAFQERSSQYQFQERPRYAPAPQESISSKDMEIISAKLDALRAMVENISHRLENLERQQQQAYEPRRQW